MKSYNIISENSKIGTNFKIGRFCIIEDNVTIGDNVELGDYSMLLSGSSVGNNTKIETYNKIHRNVVIGENCSFVSFCEIREDCRIGNDVSMGSRCTLSAGTIVENEVIIKYNFVFTDTPELTQNDKKMTGILKANSRLGANVTIMPGVMIGRNSEIGAWSQVRHNVPDNEIWYGNPAKFYKKINPDG